MDLRKGIDAAAVARDGTAFVAFLDAQPAVNRKRKVGVQGYCMGGAYVFRTAAAAAGRVGAAGMSHGGGLVTDRRTVPTCWSRRPRPSS